MPTQEAPPDEPAHGEGFAAAPASWYHLCTDLDLRKGPVSLAIPPNQSFVGFTTQSGRPVVLSSRCSHMGVDLALGSVRGERLACPLHGWEYGADGRCGRIPAGGEIPDFARQASFPVEEQGGHVFFFNRSKARFPLPFFEGLDASQMISAPGFEFTVQAPWYLVGANGFDLQHFRSAHDRTLIGEPVVDTPDSFAWRVRARFRVTGSSVFDFITRTVSGSEVEMSVTNWCGNFVLVEASFRRTTTYGLVSFVPLGPNHTRLRDLVWIKRSLNPLGRAFLDRVDVRIRSRFIREFVKSDVESSNGLRFDRRRMIEADNTLVAYLDWLRLVHH
jgi:aminopyrrolnitrin oxygenase